MQFIKNITSKDTKLSLNTISALINNSEIENFRLLAEKADFIFPFIKDKISSNFVKLINKNNLEALFEFTKIYSTDFEEMIIKSFLKFADENLTDRMLELFENGTDEQKAYCAKYFCYIKDTLAVDFLYENINSDFEPLKVNCILTLKEFGEKKILKKAKENILKSNNEIENLNDYLILSIFSEIDFILKNGLDSPLNGNIVTVLFDYNDLNSIKSIANEHQIKKILNIFAENFPETINLDTILYYQISDLIKTTEKYDDNYSKCILLLLKAKFKEFSSNDIYSFDFDKSIKQEIKNISEYLNSLKLNVGDLVFENNIQNDEFNAFLDVVFEYDIEKFDEILAEIFNENKVKCEFLARIAELLNHHNKSGLLNKNIAEKIENKNLKALILSYL